MVAICGALLLGSAQGAWSEDYSVTVNNLIYQTTHDTGCNCYPVSLTYWSGGSGSRV